MRKQFSIDGKALSYYTCGDPYGKPVFYFHGFPGCHQEINLFHGDEIAKIMGLKLIAIDRPGYGASDFQTNRRLLDWPDTVSSLADYLCISNFSILGCSGGGPYTLACAYKIPDRLLDVVIVSGMAPFAAPKMKKSLSATIPKSPVIFQKFISNNMRRMINRKPDKLLKRMNNSMSSPDKEVLNQEEVKKVFIKIMKEALSAGNEGILGDAKIYKSDWGFKINAIRHKTHLWHGEKDKNVNIQSCKYIANELQSCSTRFFPDEGHFSLLINERETILQQFI